MRLTVAVAVCACVWLAGCGVLSGSPTPTPRPAPTATPAAAVGPVPTLDAVSADVQNAFLTNLNDLTSEIEMLATAACADLVDETNANPTEVAEMKGFASTLERIGASQPALNSDDVRSSLANLQQALTQLDAALATCGIKTTP